jgi:hypothetical protein
MTAHVGQIVRVSGRSGDWRVLAEGLTLGTHLPAWCLEAIGESWVRHITVPAADVYPSLERVGSKQ